MSDTEAPKPDAFFTWHEQREEARRQRRAQRLEAAGGHPRVEVLTRLLMDVSNNHRRAEETALAIIELVREEIARAKEQP